MKIAELIVVQSTAEPHLNSLRGFHERSTRTVITGWGAFTEQTNVTVGAGTGVGFEVGGACYLLDQEAFEKFLEVIEDEEND